VFVSYPELFRLVSPDGQRAFVLTTSAVFTIGYLKFAV